MNRNDAKRDCKMCQRAAALCAIVSVLLLLPSPAPIRADIAEEGEVSAGAEALDSWWDYPWYDDQSDSIRRIDLKAKRPPPVPSAQTGSGTSWEWLGWLLLALVVVGVLFMMLRVYWTRGSRGGGSGPAALVGGPASIDRLEELPFQLEPPAGDLLSAGRRASEQGDYERAIVLLYSHQLLELDKREAIRLTKGKTNRQYLRELRLRPGLAPLLATSMVAFEDVFFGGHTLGRERFEECWRQAGQLLDRSRQQEAV